VPFYIFHRKNGKIIFPKNENEFFSEFLSFLPIKNCLKNSQRQRAFGKVRNKTNEDRILTRDLKKKFKKIVKRQSHKRTNVAKYFQNKHDIFSSFKNFLFKKREHTTPLASEEQSRATDFIDGSFFKKI
jgi:hypothetical protein